MEPQHNITEHNITKDKDILPGKSGVAPVKEIEEAEEPVSAKQNPEKKKKKEPKHRYGEYQHVLLSDKEYADLTAEYGEKPLKAGIKRVDEYCESHGKSYKNYSVVLRNWGIRTASPPTKREDYFTAGRHDDDGTAEAKAKVIEMSARGLL